MIHSFRDGKWVEISVAEAIAQVREALETIPREIEALKRMGVVYTSQMIYDEALRIGLIGKWRKWLKFGNRLTRRQKALAIFSLIQGEDDENTTR